MKPCVKTPCPQCAFTRSSIPGALGGSPPEVYIGQAYGPFYVPCHMQYGERESMAQVKAECEQIHQCAGMAIFRANLGIDRHLPGALTKLPKDPALVFATEAEFLSHHMRVDKHVAMSFLAANPPATLLQRAMGKINRVIPIKEEQ